MVIKLRLVLIVCRALLRAKATLKWKPGAEVFATADVNRPVISLTKLEYWAEYTMYVANYAFKEQVAEVER